MKPRNLLIAAIILAALCGGVWWANKHPQASQPAPTAKNSTQLTSIADADVQALTIKKKDGSAVTVDRSGGKWVITTPQQLPADQDAVSSIVSALSPLTADSVVEEKTSDPGKFGLANPSLTVGVKVKNGKSQTISFGDDVPAGSLVYVRMGDSAKIDAIASSVRSTFDKGLNDLRDKRLLTFDSTKLTQIEVSAPKSDIVFEKRNAKDWIIEKPKPYRADSFQVEELLRNLSEAKMDLSGMEDQRAIDAAFKIGQPVATAKLTDVSGTQSLELRKSKNSYYATSSVVPGTYKVTADLGKQFEKSLDDYRNRKIFDFGFSDPTKLDLKVGASDKAYVRADQTWKLNGNTMDSASVQTLIDKLRDLSATSFVDKGFTTPTLEVTVAYNSGKATEQVSFAKTPDGYIAKRGTEAAMYLVDAKAIDDILGASKAIKPSASASKK
jgi:hypothetical protein